MNTALILRFGLLIVLVGFSGFFSASETALMSLSKIRIRNMVDSGVKRAMLIERLIENPSSLLGTVLVGNTVINIGASSLATAMFIELLGAKGVGVSTAVMTVAILIFAEITPKSLAVINSEAFSLKVVNLMSIFVKLLRPIVYVVTTITNFFVRLLGGRNALPRPSITEEELRTIVNVSEEEGVLEGEEREMIYNVFEFGDLLVKEVMIPRRDIIAIDVESTYEEIVEIIREEHYARLIVYRENIDNVVGIINIKDLFCISSRENFSVERYMRKAYYTFEYKKVAELLKDMKKERAHMAVVIDEYGGTAGIVTISDLIEEIVGEIDDEYDDEEEDIFVIKEDEYIVSGSVRIDVVNDMLGTSIESEDFDTIGGFVIGLFGRIPGKNEAIQYEGIHFTVLVVESNRIIKIKIET